MSDFYYFPGQFKCMYCKIDLETEFPLTLGTEDTVNLKCPKCEAVWQFWIHIQLSHRLLKGGKYNKIST